MDAADQVTELKDTIRRITEGGAEDRRTVAALRQELHDLKNPPAPTVTLSVAVMQGIVKYLMSRPYAEVSGLLAALHKETADGEA